MRIPFVHKYSVGNSVKIGINYAYKEEATNSFLKILVCFPLPIIRYGVYKDFDYGYRVQGCRYLKTYLGIRVRAKKSNLEPRLIFKKAIYFEPLGFQKIII